MLIKRYTDFTINRSGINSALSDKPCLGISFKLECDVSHLFPFINAEIESTRYFSDPEYIQFMLYDSFCSLFANELIAVQFANEREARIFAGKAVEFLNDLHSRRDSITPDHKSFKQLSVIDILNLVPQTNCKECGQSTCLAFAALLSKYWITQDKCPYFAKPINENAVYPVYDKSGRLRSKVVINTDIYKAVAEESGEENKLLPRKIETEFQTVLTEREIEVLRHVAAGDSNKKISDKLMISQNTVKTHVTHIFNKLGVNDRTQAAVWAALNGVL